MKAVVWHGPSKVSVDEVDDPSIQEPTDAVIRITATAICGSDLHLYGKGAAMGMLPGDIIGHEPMGVVEEVGSEVTHIRPGDRVVVPFNISCGTCRLCRKGFFCQCETTQNLEGRKGAALFGYTHLYGGVPGGQAEYLRVPQAHFGPIKIDESVPELGALLLSDVLPTAWQAVHYAEVEPGDVVAVYGLGPIGQMCVRMARHQGATRVIASRRGARTGWRRAPEWGAETIDDSEHKDPATVIEDMTDGLGADRVIDAVGMEAHGSVADRVLQAMKLQPDRLIALHHAMASVRRGGTLSVTGVYTGAMQMFPLGDLFDRQVTLRWGQANVRRWTDDAARPAARRRPARRRRPDHAGGAAGRGGRLVPPVPEEGAGRAEGRAAPLAARARSPGAQARRPFQVGRRAPRHLVAPAGAASSHHWPTRATWPTRAWLYSGASAPAGPRAANSRARRCSTWRATSLMIWWRARCRPPGDSRTRIRKPSVHSST